ncbi:hypothetical protein DPMN_026530 [Dreissena polymorpha]|uniref:Uncharacterized protein n=1 Tax=Dreissena polymorpha TaxID=45954 RepID=A0A9D4LRB4_DREPO|nr:hypothetical protein DPMN_026530 [Dreissena polymorpha]
MVFQWSLIILLRTCPSFPLQGEYFLVRDHELVDGDNPRSIGLLQAKSWAPVNWCGQPTARELASIVKALENESYSVGIYLGHVICDFGLPPGGFNYLNI